MCHIQTWHQRPFSVSSLPSLPIRHLYLQVLPHRCPCLRSGFCDLSPEQLQVLLKWFLLVASQLVSHLLAKVILWKTTLMIETLFSGYYLYGTCKLCAYIYSNFCSRVKETTVRKFSIASVAICNRAPNHPGAQRQMKAVNLNSIKERKNMY